MGMSMNNEIGYEIDFLPVGEGEKSGDAIALRWGNLLLIHHLNLINYEQRIT
jgi:hypothetical protein